MLYIYWFQDLLLGGTDTSTTTVEFVIMALVKHPLLIEKVTEELDRVVGRDRWVEEDDFPKLPLEHWKGSQLL